MSAHDPLVRETHISILLFLGERVLKLRKPLRLDFADFSTLSNRAEDCRREVELNRRLAPDVYLGVADVTLDGETLDHLVVMRRLPAERSLAHLARSEPEAECMAEVRRVARAMADFHARADRSTEISACATVEEVTGQFEANVSAVAPFVGPVLERHAHDSRGVGRPSLPGGPRIAVLGSHRGRPDLRRPWGSSGRRHLLPRGRPEDPRLPRVRRPPSLRGRGGRRGLSGHGPREARGRQGVDAIRARVRGGSRGAHTPVVAPLLHRSARLCPDEGRLHPSRTGRPRRGR